MPCCAAAVTSYRIVGVPINGAGGSITQSGKGVHGAGNQVSVVVVGGWGVGCGGGGGGGGGVGAIFVEGALYVCSS